jgi:V8-like Glu-specific endopeptidase
MRHISWAGRRGPGAGRRAGRLAARVLASAVVYAATLLVPAAVGAAAVGDGRLPSRQLPAARAFGGQPAVGALFTVSAGQLGTHFCTASVVHSARRDLAVTAAHCVTGSQLQFVFVPGYASGKAPYGVWQVTAVYADQAWRSARSPDDDVAFLRLSVARDGARIEEVTGAERFGAGWHPPAPVQVVGYPDGADQPVSCTNQARSFAAAQLEFDCGGYTDGTSGSPFLADVSAASRQGTVVGVIGGYEQGGDTPDVSYSSAFGPAVEALYRELMSASG